MKLILSHPTANNCSRAVANTFLQEDILYEFHTSIAAFPGNIWHKLQRFKSLAEIGRRNFDVELEPYTRTWPWFEIGRMLSLKGGMQRLTRHESGFFCTDAVYNSIDNHVAYGLRDAVRHGVNAVYAYEDGALATFTAAKKLGIKCIYDLPIAYWETGKKLMSEDAERLPKWAATLGGGIYDSPQKLQKKIQELELADVVVVPSQFVKDSLPLWAQSKKLIMAPFGTPTANDYITGGKAITRPLRIMFAGSMGQRKGLGDLFAAVKLLNTRDVELVVMGSLLAPIDFYQSECYDFIYEPGRPHHKVLELMRSCDIFCLPSIVEGRALVMQEAMSQELPLIITANTGGEDLIIEGVTGFLVPIRSPEIIAEKIKWFLANREKIPEMGKMAKAHSLQYTWANYGKIVLKGINDLLR